MSEPVPTHHQLSHPREVPPDFAIPQLEGATPFINRFAPVAFVLFNQFDPTDALANAPFFDEQGVVHSGYAYLDSFKNLYLDQL